MNLKKSTATIAIPLFFLCLFTYLLLINFLYPVQADDFVFAFLQNKNLIDIFTQAFIATKNVYFNWSGRFFGYFFHYAAMASFTFFNIVNTVVFCAFVYAIFLNIKLRRPQHLFDIFTLFLIVAMLWIFVMGLAEASFWKTGSGYLWTITGTLFFTYPFLQLLENKDVISGNPAKVALITVAAFMLGTGAENLSVAVCLFLIFACIIYWRSNKKLPVAIGIVTISYILGTIFLIAAPGNYVRAAVFKVQEPYILSIFIKFLPFSHAVFHHFIYKNYALLPPIVLAIIALAAAIILSFNKRKLHKERFIAFLFLSLIATFALIGAPTIFINGRTIFYSDILFILAMLTIISQLDSIKYWKILYCCLSLIVFIALLPNFKSNYQDLKSIRTQLIARDELIRLFQDNKNKNAIMQAIYIPSLKTDTYETPQIYTLPLIFWDVPHDSVNWITNNFAYYYGFTNVTLRPYVEVWNNIANKIDATQAEKKFSILIKNQVLFYITTQGSCDSIPDKHQFFLNIYPQNLKDLPKKQQQRGFDNITFGWEPKHQVTVLTSQANEKQDVCVLATTLPNYGIKRIEAGQYNLVNNQMNPEWTEIILSDTAKH